MPRYIDADVAIDAVNRLSLGETDVVKLSMRIVDYLNRILPADVAPVRHGKWVYGEHEWQDGWYCSECHFFIPWYYDWYGLDFRKDFHACPHCSAKMVTYTGAKMDGGAE